MPAKKVKYPKNANGDYICPHCPKVTTNMNTMHYHIKTNHDDEDLPHQCKFCDMKFLHLKTLETHMYSKHPERVRAEDRPSFVCPFEGCDFQSLTSGGRRIHYMRKHCGTACETLKLGAGTEIQCSACQREFKSSTAFYYHVYSCIDHVEYPQLDVV